MSAQTIGHGTQFELGSALTSPVYTAIAGVVSVAFGSDKRDAIDNTDMLTGGSTRTFVGGLENAGDCSVKLNVLPGDATQTSLKTAEDGALHTFQVSYPNGTTTRQFQGIIVSFDEDIPQDKLPTFTVKIQISGPITRVF